MATLASDPSMLRLPNGRYGHPNSRQVRLAVYGIQFLLDFAAIYIAERIASGMHITDHMAGHLDPVMMMLFPAYALIAFLINCYSFDAMMSATRSLTRMASSLALSFGLILVFTFALGQEHTLSRPEMFKTGLFALALLTMVRPPMLLLVRRLGNAFLARLLIIDGQPATTSAEFEVLDAREAGLTPDLRNPHMLDAFAALVHGYDRVVVSCPAERRESWAIYLKGSGCWGQLLIPELHAIAYSGGAGGMAPGIVVSVGPLNMRNRILKRIFDLSIAVPAVIALSPLLFLTALVIKLESAGPILFRQRRMGRGNQMFHVYKFRSMRVECSDADGNRSASRDDDRITRVGRIIRATSIDELPQLFNVILGDMSLVGPRPHALGSLAGERLFWHVDQRYWLRHALKPGITGLAQVRGYRGATDREEDLVNRLQSDLEYVSDWSIVGDISILVRTAVVLAHKNAY